LTSGSYTGISNIAAGKAFNAEKGTAQLTLPAGNYLIQFTDNGSADLVASATTPSVQSMIDYSITGTNLTDPAGSATKVVLGTRNVYFLQVGAGGATATFTIYDTMTTAPVATSAYLFIQPTS
jgi:hypothetical protein